MKKHPVTAEPTSADSTSLHRVFVRVLAMMNVPKLSKVHAAAAYTALRTTSPWPANGRNTQPCRSTSQNTKQGQGQVRQTSVLQWRSAKGCTAASALSRPQSSRRWSKASSFWMSSARLASPFTHPCHTCSSTQHAFDLSQVNPAAMNSRFRSS